jgi:hypothetical protein
MGAHGPPIREQGHGAERNARYDFNNHGQGCKNQYLLGAQLTFFLDKGKIMPVFPFFQSMNVHKSLRCQFSNNDYFQLSIVFIVFLTDKQLFLCLIR